MVKGRQHYCCHGCEYRHTVPYCGKSPALKRQALELYLELEGLGFRSVGRLINCSHVTVYTWIKAFGDSIDALRSAAGDTVIEMDEFHSFIVAKETPVGSGSPCKTIPHCVLGAHATDTG